MYTWLNMKRDSLYSTPQCVFGFIATNLCKNYDGIWRVTLPKCFLFGSKATTELFQM